MSNLKHTVFCLPKKNSVMFSLVLQNFRELLDDISQDTFDMNDGVDKFEEKVRATHNILVGLLRNLVICE